jgi:PIN domain nuclease of toxin-antitoxin system
MIYVLDACAMIAYLRDERGADMVEQAITDTASQCIAHAINLCEVFYDFHRVGGETSAITAIDDLFVLGVSERVDFDRAFWQDVGILKAGGKISLADCCAVTLTNRVGATLLTSDHLELDRVAAKGICPIDFIR